MHMLIHCDTTERNDYGYTEYAVAMLLLLDSEQRERIVSSQYFIHLLGQALDVSVVYSMVNCSLAQVVAPWRRRLLRCARDSLPAWSVLPPLPHLHKPPSTHATTDNTM